MSFNAQSYYRNKAKREALKYLGVARNAKAEGDPERTSTYARLARSQWRTYRMYLRLDECDSDLKLRLAGKMSHSDFMEKWS